MQSGEYILSMGALQQLGTCTAQASSLYNHSPLSTGCSGEASRQSQLMA